MSPETQHTINRLAALCENRLANLDLDAARRDVSNTLAETIFLTTAWVLLNAHEDWLNEDSDEAMVEVPNFRSSMEVPCTCGPPTPRNDTDQCPRQDDCYEAWHRFTHPDLDDVEANAEVGW